MSDNKPLDTPDERPQLPPAAQKEIQDDLDDYEIKFRDALDKHFGITRPPGENERRVKGGASQNQDSATFQELKHPRAPVGTSQGGQFTSGDYQTIQRLEREASAGIKEIESVVESLKNQKIKVTENWMGLSDEDKEKVEKDFKKESFEGQLAYHKGNKEAAEEDLDAQWHGMSDKEKFEMAKMFLSSTLVEPKKFAVPEKFAPLGSDSPDYTSRKEKVNLEKYYRDTQLFARAVSVERAAQLLMKEGFFKDINKCREEALATDEQIWTAWKKSSTSIDGVRMQKASAEEFGTHYYSNPKINLEVSKIFANEDQQDQFKIMMRAKWETTQYMLNKANIKELNVYRAVGIPRNDIYKTREETLPEDPNYTRLPNIDIKRNGAASTTLTPLVANEWNATGFGNTRVVIRAIVPNVAVLSVPAYGINEKSEKEVVVIGAPWTAWDAFLGKAPYIESVPVAKKHIEDSRVTRTGKLIITFPEEDGTGGHWLTRDRILNSRARLAKVRETLDSPIFQETEHPRGPGGKFSTKPESGSGKVPWWMKHKEEEQEQPKGTNASELLSKYFIQGISAREIVDEFPGAKEKIEQVEEQIKKLVPTDAPVEKGGFKKPDGQYTQERKRLHWKIVQKVLSGPNVIAATPNEGEKPILTLLGGRGGSGKSWLTKEGPVNRQKAIYINSDDIQPMLPGYEKWKAAAYHEEASDIANLIKARAREMGLSVILDATMRSPKFSKEIEQFSNAGYRVEGYYMFAAPHIAAERAIGRFMRGDRYVPPSYSLSSTTNESTFDGVKGSLDKWAVYDNMGKSPVLHAKGGDWK